MWGQSENSSLLQCNLYRNSTNIIGDEKYHTRDIQAPCGYVPWNYFLENQRSFYRYFGKINTQWPVELVSWRIITTKNQEKRSDLISRFFETVHERWQVQSVNSHHLCWKLTNIRGLICQGMLSVDLSRNPRPLSFTNRPSPNLAGRSRMGKDQWTNLLRDKCSFNLINHHIIVRRHISLSTCASQSQTGNPICSVLRGYVKKEKIPDDRKIIRENTFKNVPHIFKEKTLYFMIGTYQPIRPLSCSSHTSVILQGFYWHSRWPSKQMDCLWW